MLNNAYAVEHSYCALLFFLEAVVLLAVFLALVRTGVFGALATEDKRAYRNIQAIIIKQDRR